MVLSTVFAVAMQSDEPTMRNSNLLPVKANGEVRLRSVASLLRTGSVETPVSSWPPAMQPAAVPFCHDLLHNILELIAEEDGDNGGRRLVRAEAVVIADAGCGHAQQVRMAVDGLDDAREHQQELQILVRRLARVEQVLAEVAS